jgi:hypothetical protein
MRSSAEDCPRGPVRYERLFRVLLVLACVDSLAYGIWAVFWPDDLFRRLELPARGPITWKLLGIGLETADHILLWRVLGALILAQALILALVAWRPSAWGGLVMMALIGRLLPLGMWLWLLGTERVELRAAPLRCLAVHDGVWVLVFTAYLILWGLRKPV